MLRLDRRIQYSRDSRAQLRSLWNTGCPDFAGHDTENVSHPSRGGFRPSFASLSTLEKDRGCREGRRMPARTSRARVFNAIATREAVTEEGALRHYLARAYQAARSCSCCSTFSRCSASALPFQPPFAVAREHLGVMSPEPQQRDLELQHRPDRLEPDIQRSGDAMLLLVGRAVCVKKFVGHLRFLLGLACCGSLPLSSLAVEATWSAQACFGGTADLAICNARY